MEIDFGAIPDEAGGAYLQPGRYYCEITKCDYHQGPHDDWGYKLTLTCCAGDDHGKSINTNVFPSWKKDMKHAFASRLKKLVSLLGLLPEGNAKLTLEPPMLIGKRLWVTVVMGDPYIAKKGKKAGQEVQYPEVDMWEGFAVGDAPPDFAPLPVEDVPL